MVRRKNVLAIISFAFVGSLILLKITDALVALRASDESAYVLEA